MPNNITNIFNQKKNISILNYTKEETITGHMLDVNLDIPINLQRLPSEILIVLNIYDNSSSTSTDTIYIINSKYHKTNLSTHFCAAGVYIAIKSYTTTKITLKISNTIAHSQKITFKEIIAIE